MQTVCSLPAGWGESAQTIPDSYNSHSANKTVINIVIDCMRENNIGIEHFELTDVVKDIERTIALDENYCLKFCVFGHIMDYY